MRAEGFRSVQEVTTITASKRFKGMRMQERAVAKLHKGESKKKLTKGVPGKNSRWMKIRDGE